jgi:hypothetical protein
LPQLFILSHGERGQRRESQTELHINIPVRGIIKKKKKGRPKPSLHMIEFAFKAIFFLHRML